MKTGVCFLSGDEVAEFSPRVLDALRTPMETGEVSIARSASHVRYPARFQLVLAANPCPCGRYGIAGASCSCAPMSVRRYQQRLSGPVLDRVDIHHLMAPSLLGQSEATAGDPSAVVAERVQQARERQQHRLSELPWQLNAQVPGAQLRKLPAPEGMQLVDDAVRRGQLSARGVDKTVRLAWTLADLGGNDTIRRSDLLMALNFRSQVWGSAA